MYHNVHLNRPARNKLAMDMHVIMIVYIVDMCERHCW